MKSLPPIPDFNLQQEADDTCQLCNISIPSELQFIQPTFIGDSYKDLCPACALGMRNLLMKLPKTAKYASSQANELYFQFISWKEQEGK
jgi:hypothetical protein